MKSNNPCLEAVSVTVSRFAAAEAKTVLDQVSLSLLPGAIVHVQGPSGSGKSTLLWALARMLPREHGHLYLMGRPESEWPAPLWRDRVALVLQKHAMIAGSVQENLLLPWTLKVRRTATGSDARGLVPRPAETVLRAELDRLGLGDVELTADATKLSVGQTARVSLIRSLLTAADCLLLDEPCAALDDDASARVMARIQAFAAAGGAALVAGHNRPTAESRVLRLEQGKLTEVRA
jgi:putative ABC transport system ATP-binding protein